MSDNGLLAKKDYEKAIEHAKSGADLEILGKIYLTKCAMETIVGERTNCTEYEMIESTLSNQNLSAYKNFLQGSITNDMIVYIPKKYHLFMQYLLSQNYQETIKIIHNTQDVVSMLLIASIVKEYLSVEDIDKIIKISSFYGYTKATKYWLGYKGNKFGDTKSQNILKVLEK